MALRRNQLIRKKEGVPERDINAMCKGELKFPPWLCTMYLVPFPVRSRGTERDHLLAHPSVWSSGIQLAPAACFQAVLSRAALEGAPLSSRLPAMGVAMPFFGSLFVSHLGLSFFNLFLHPSYLSFPFLSLFCFSFYSACEMIHGPGEFQLGLG